jgi:PhnB protein
VPGTSLAYIGAMSTVHPVPPEYGSITPYLVLSDCGKAIEFYKAAFGAKERMRMPGPGGTVGHAELTFGDSIVMMADGSGEHPGTTSLICFYVEDCDAVFKRAIEAGATELEPVTDKFYGDRAGSLRDPFGQRWGIMTHKEDLSEEEVLRRMAAMNG